MSERDDIRKRMITVIVSVVISSALLFLGAGTLRWPRAWIYIGVNVLSLLVNTIVLLRVNPEVIAARARRGDGTKPFDVVFGRVFLILTLAFPLVAGLAARWCPPAFGPVAAGVGVLLMISGDTLVLAAMAVNKFLEPTVRIQHDRGHEVVSTGPYRWVRHPMYVGVIVQYLGASLLLGSVWALVVAGLIGAALVVRTSLEDRTLRAELAGYETYALRTRYRLIPGVW